MSAGTILLCPGELSCGHALLCGTAEMPGQPGQGKLCSPLPAVLSQCVCATLRDEGRSSGVQCSALLLPSSLPVLLPLAFIQC